MFKTQIPVTIIEGNHKELKPFLFNLLKEYAELSSKNIDVLLSDENMIEFKKAFTSPNVNPDFNYEFYEVLGDSTSNNCIVWYFQRRFFADVEHIKTSKGSMGPVAIMGRLKQIGFSDVQFSKFAKTLGLMPYITMTNIDETRSMKILEDVFESFIGCLVYNCDKNFGLHTGYVIAYAIIQKLLDSEEISLERESLYEPKSIINEDITKFPKGFKLNYLHTENKNPEKYNEKFITRAVIVDNNNNVLIETPVYVASNKQENEQKAAKYLLTNNNYKNLKKMYNIL